MSDTIVEELENYFNGLPATNIICSTLGTTFSSGNNLFIGIEPATKTSLSIHSYGGREPNEDNYRQEPSVQIRLKTTTSQKAHAVMQRIINTLHMNDTALYNGGNTKGLVKANQSAPILLEIRDGGESFITVSNYTIKHIKI